KWITMKEQQRNKRNNRIITYNGESLTLVEWGEIYNINPDRIGARLKNGWSVEDALSKEVKSPMKKKIENLGLEMKKYRKENNMTQKDLADIFEVRHSLVSRWENGQRYPTTKHIEKIKSILKIGERCILLYIVTGATNSGKTTLVDNIVTATGIKKIVTYTNRDIRDEESDNIDYNFIDTKQFDKEDFVCNRVFYTKIRKEPYIYAVNKDDLLPFEDS